jgi:hypothetical protein
MMKIERVEVIPSSRSDKRAMAVFYFEGTDKTKKVHFGSPNAYTYYDGATAEKKENYLKRHEVNEDWVSPLTAGFWARWMLWSFKKTSIHVIKKLIKRKSDLEIPTINIDLPSSKKPKTLIDYNFKT